VNLLLKNSKMKKIREDNRFMKGIFGSVLVTFLLAILLGIFIHFAFAIGLSVLVAILMGVLIRRAGLKSSDNLLI
jgi:hypothetical protein